MSKTETTAIKSKIDAAVEDLKNKLVAGVKLVDGKVEVENGQYLSNLPEGLTPEIVEKLDDYNSVFFPASTLAFSEVIIPEFAKNKELKELTAVFPLSGDNTWEVNIAAKAENNVVGKPGEKVMAYGRVSTALNVTEARNNIGQLKQVKLAIGRAATAALAE